jgi:hypothetical protein
MCSKGLENIRRECVCDEGIKRGKEKILPINTTKTIDIIYNI